MSVLIPHHSNNVQMPRDFHVTCSLSIQIAKANSMLVSFLMLVYSFVFCFFISGDEEG